jgi:hypothetical protein
MITEIDKIQRIGTEKPRESNFQYFVKLKNENNLND